MIVENVINTHLCSICNIFLYMGLILPSILNKLQYCIYYMYEKNVSPKLITNLLGSTGLKIKAILCIPSSQNCNHSIMSSLGKILPSMMLHLQRGHLSLT